MQELVSAVAALAGIVEKGGIIGLLVIAVAFAFWWIHQLRKELIRTYRQRDFCRQVRARYRFALDNAGITVKIDDIESEMKEDELEKE